MISQSQATQLADIHNIDLYSIYREYLQLVILNELYQLEASHDLIFKGGTALRLIYQSPRFSEDLDFNANCDHKTTKQLLDDTFVQIRQHIPHIYVKYPKSLLGLTAKIYLPLEISKQDLTVKMDFSFRQKILDYNQTTVKTKFPVSNFALIRAMTREEILAEKVGAILTRNKARDIYDLWWLLNSGTNWQPNLIKAKLNHLNIDFQEKKLRQQVKQRVSDYPQKKLTQRLNKCLSIKNRNVVPELPRLVKDLIDSPIN